MSGPPPHSTHSGRRKSPSCRDRTLRGLSLQPPDEDRFARSDERTLAQARFLSSPQKSLRKEPAVLPGRQGASFE
jgi:hypothetical protein